MQFDSQGGPRSSIQPELPLETASFCSPGRPVTERFPCQSKLDKLSELPSLRYRCPWVLRSPVYSKYRVNVRCANANRTRCINTARKIRVSIGRVKNVDGVVQRTVRITVKRIISRRIKLRGVQLCERVSRDGAVVEFGSGFARNKLPYRRQPAPRYAAKSRTTVTNWTRTVERRDDTNKKVYTTRFLSVVKLHGGIPAAKKTKRVVRARVSSEERRGLSTSYGKVAKEVENISTNVTNDLPTPYAIRIALRDRTRDKRFDSINSDASSGRCRGVEPRATNNGPR
ncbi:uncharacterized protein LOC143150569 [Ptiloglossa arizonensis]|uniref:uncharacterized protein LOC143150569 n=1 Tax=Ptiloglossa arizonensis TaxID=3350558 RepID=UPI003FA17565